MWFEGDVTNEFDSSFESIEDLIHESIIEELDESFVRFLIEYYGIIIGFENETIRFEYTTDFRVLLSADLNRIYADSIREFGSGYIPEVVNGTECEDEYRLYYQLKHEFESDVYEVRN